MEKKSERMKSIKKAKRGKNKKKSKTLNKTSKFCQNKNFDSAQKSKISDIKKNIKKEMEDKKGQLERAYEEAEKEQEEASRKAKRKGLLNRAITTAGAVIYAVSTWGCAPSQYHKPKYHEKAHPAEYGEKKESGIYIPGVSELVGKSVSKDIAKEFKKGLKNLTWPTKEEIEQLKRERAQHKK